MSAPKLVPEGEYTERVEDAIPGVTQRGTPYVRLRFTVAKLPIFASIGGPLARMFCEHYEVAPDAQSLAEWCKDKTFTFTVKHEEWKDTVIATTRIGSLVK